MDGEASGQLEKHLQEAVALERSVLRMLESLARTGGDPELQAAAEEHKAATREHVERLEERLAAHGSSPSRAREAVGVLTAATKGAVDLVRREKPGRSARDAYVSEHAEVAAYELLERVARRAGDEETASVARQNRAEDLAMALQIADGWDRFAERSLEPQDEPASGGGAARGIAGKVASAARSPLALGAGVAAVVAGGVVAAARLRRRDGDEERPRSPDGEAGDDGPAGSAGDAAPGRAETESPIEA